MRLRLLAAAVPVAGAALPDAQASGQSSDPPSAVQTIDADQINAHLRFLTDARLAGREAGTPGGALAARYVAAQFQAAGLEPAGTDGSFFQSFPVIELDPAASIVVGVAQRTSVFRAPDDFVAWPANADSVLTAEGELVFVGHGIDEPEHQWDDYAGTSMTGRVALALSHDPGFTDSTLFDGRRGSAAAGWQAKVAQAARMGATGIVLVHSDARVGLPWTAVRNRWSGSILYADGTRPTPLRFVAWMREDAARRIIGAAGIDYDVMTNRARRSTFRPIPTGARLVIDIVSGVRRFRAENVVGRVPGDSSTAPVVAVARYDGLGSRTIAPGDTAVVPSAHDAAGAAVMIAAAAALGRSTPAQDLYFVASVGDDPFGLGATTFLQRSVGRNAAVTVALSRANLWGPTHDIGAAGSDTTTWAVIAAAAAPDSLTLRHTTPEPPDSRDPTVRAVGAMGRTVTIHPGRAFRGQPQGWGPERERQFLADERYRPADHYEGTDVRGAAQQARTWARLLWHLAHRPVQDKLEAQPNGRP